MFYLKLEKEMNRIGIKTKEMRFFWDCTTMRQKWDCKDTFTVANGTNLIAMWKDKFLFNTEILNAQTNKVV